MIEEMGWVDQNDIDFLLASLNDVRWRHKSSQADDFYVYECEDTPFGCDNAYFLKIPPGGRIHPHIDTSAPRLTLHFPLQTNPNAVTVIDDEPVHMEVGFRYRIDRKVMHHSVNHGSTDRIHLMAEYK